MAASQTALIVLAAGKGTRMVSARPKVLHEVAGRTLLAHALASAADMAPTRVVVVAGHGAEAVETEAAHAWPGAVTVRQEDQRGTAHAVAAARGALEGFDGPAFVLYGDTPFIAPATLQAMLAAHIAGAAVVVLGFEAADPGRYGRMIVRDGALERIVEFKDATEAERAVRLCNSGIVLADAALMIDLVAQVGCDNAAGEYYLPDIVAIARARGLPCRAVTCEEAETLGVNTRADLARAEAVFQARRRAEMMAAGVTLQAPDTVHFAADTEIAADTVVEPNVVFGPGVRVSGPATIRAFSHIEGAEIGAGAVVGPHARLRPGAEIGADSRVGNFVEIKAARLGAGVKVNHLSYVGDAEIGARTNVGAGTVTCNYDGVFKHRTVIGHDAFIGSNTMLVAPVAVGDRAVTASGSVVTRDVPAGDLAVARARQDNKPGFGAKMMARLRAMKAARAAKKAG